MFIEWDHLMREAAKEEIALVKKAIIDKYGFEPSEEYCRDFIIFINKVLKGEADEQRE